MGKNLKKGVDKTPFFCYYTIRKKKGEQNNVRDLLQQPDDYEEDGHHQRGNHLGLLR